MEHLKRKLKIKLIILKKKIKINETKSNKTKVTKATHLATVSSNPIAIIEDKHQDIIKTKTEETSNILSKNITIPYNNTNIEEKEQISNDIEQNQKITKTTENKTEEISETKKTKSTHLATVHLTLLLF